MIKNAMVLPIADHVAFLYGHDTTFYAVLSPMRLRSCVRGLHTNPLPSINTNAFRSMKRCAHRDSGQKLSESSRLRLRWFQ